VVPQGGEAIGKGRTPFIVSSLELGTVTIAPAVSPAPKPPVRPFTSSGTMAGPAALHGASGPEAVVWTPVDRALVRDFGSGRALTDGQFRLLEPLIPPAKPGGRPRTTDMRNLPDGLFYLVRTGCQWRHMPPRPAFPPWRTVYGYMRAFLRDGVWESIRHQFAVMLREGAGREASPTAAVIDTQSVKTRESGGPRGWDAAKRLKGRKRHVAVDTDGLLLGVLVHAADIQDADGLGDLLKCVKPLYPWLRAVFADSIYNRNAA
jgi:putative transposase